MNSSIGLRTHANREVALGVSGNGDGVDPEVREQGTRRRFSTEYKLRVLQEADSCKKHGELGQLLRREGLHSTHLSTWRRQQYDLPKYGAVGRSGGRKAAEIRLKQLERENARLKRKLERAEAIVDIQKKLPNCWGYH